MRSAPDIPEVPEMVVRLRGVSKHYGSTAAVSELDLDVVKRMIELQFQLMNDDPERLYRARWKRVYFHRTRCADGH